MRWLLAAGPLLLLLPVVAAQSITIQYPVGGEVLTANSTIVARWTSSGVNHYQLWWTRDSSLGCGSEGWTLLQAHPYFPNTYDWRLPDINSTAVRFRVEGHNVNHQTLGYACSGEFSVLIPQGQLPPPTPTGLVAVALTPFQVRVSWNAAANALGYVLFRNSQLRANLSATGLADAASPATAYSYQVLAWNANGNSSLSAQVSVTTPAVGPGPGFVSVAPSGNISTGLGQNQTFAVTLDQNAGVRWFLDGSLVANVSNASASALTLNGTAGFHLVRVNASNGNGSSSFAWGWTVLANATCRVDVYGLDVQGNTISGAVRNIGSLDTTVNVTTLVGLTAVQSVNASLRVNETVNLSSDYGFPVGVTRVTMRAAASCGTGDEEVLEHTVLQPISCQNPGAPEGANRCDYVQRQYLQCNGGIWAVVATNQTDYCNNCGIRVCGDGACNCGESLSTCASDCRLSYGYTGNRACSDSQVVLEYLYPNGTRAWIPSAFCAYGCSGGACVSGPVPSTGACGVLVEQFDYQNPVFANQIVSATIAARNTGSAAANFNLTLFANAAVRGFWSQTVEAGGLLSKTFSYSPPASDYLLTAQAASSCGSSSTRAVPVSVLPPPAAPQPAQPLPLLPLPSRPAVIERTEVSFFPDQLEIPAFRTKVVAIRIQSKQPQEFTIAASGLPAAWLSYERSIRVDQEVTGYVFVTPTTPGNDTLKLTVTAVAEQLAFPATVAVYVAPALPPSGLGWLDAWLAELQRALAAVQASPLLLTALIVLVFIIVVAIGVAVLRIELF